MHALPRQSKRAGGIGNRHRRMSRGGQHLPASAGLARWLREPISFKGQMSGKANDRDGEFGESIAGRRTGR
ncbi:hypothetical protein EFR01_22330 [Sinorhizobium fredii]|nr:hypothetical protein EFR01_22330 [Sinorhizobium fredii]GLS07837.1 hypothetical protein GCM10007864_14650 [Sinorhizobium fredii]